MAVIYRCPGTPGTEYGHVQDLKSVHSALPDGCCARFGQMTPAQQRQVGWTYPAPELTHEMMCLTPATVELLAAVDGGHVHWVDQRTSKYGINFDTGRRCTRPLRWLIEQEAVAKGWDKGVRCSLTRLGAAALAHHR